MPTEDVRPSARITAAFATLVESAKAINEASAALAKPVAQLEKALHRLNAGVACWTKISGGRGQHGEYWSRDVGYARVRGQWSLAIRTVEGDDADPEDRREEMWRFNEAPHYLRVKAVDKLPELVEAMVEATNAAAKRLAEKTTPAQELADAVSVLVDRNRK